MNHLLKAAQELNSLAKKADLPFDKYIKALSVTQEHEEALQNERRACPAEKEAIAKTLAELNGQLSPDLPVGEILSRAGVRRAQGTVSFVKREVRRLLEITHQQP